MPVHPTALIDPQAAIHPEANIGAHVVIEGPVRIGAGCQVAPFAMLMGHTELAEGCQIHAHAVLGDVPQDRAYQGNETYCRIGRACIIREGATVHRGTAPGSATVIGDRCYLMTNSHVGHNCLLGNDVTLISGSLLGGHVIVGDRAVVSGNAAVHQFVRIGELAMISGMGKITQDVPPFFMTDRDGAIVGLNRVGMTRAGMSAEERDEIKVMYRLFCRSGMTHRDAVSFLSGTVATPAGRRLLEFLSATTKRGVARMAEGKERRAKSSDLAVPTTNVNADQLPS